MKKILLVLFFGSLLFGCSKKPIYSVDTCFPDGFSIIEIYNITDTHYMIRVNSLLTIERQYGFEVFENRIKTEGLIPKSCNEFRNGDK